MKKIILAVLGLMTFATVHAQQTVIVQKTPGLLEGIVDAAVAVVTAPVVFGAAVVSGVEEVFAPAVVGTTRITTIPRYPAPVVTAPAPVVTVPPAIVAPAPAVVAPPAIVAPPPAVVPAPVIVAPPVVSPECHRTPHVSTTTITTQTVSPGGVVTVQSYTRPVSAYETGVPLTPVPVEHRVGTSPCVNPYIYRHR